MNRLIIIGNGFDLAHNLKTKYSDFINDYWRKVIDTSYSDKFISFNISGFDLSTCSGLKSVIEYLNVNANMNLWKKSGTSNFYNNSNSVIKFHNDFFCRINERYDDANWVDIEMEYYTSLKRILNRSRIAQEDDDVFESKSLADITKLNKDIFEIAKAFESYLLENVVPNLLSKYNNRVEDIFDNYDLNESEINRFYEEFPKKFIEKTLKKKFQLKRNNNLPLTKFDKTYILNFNYTSTVNQYVRTRLNNDAIIINIHGELNNLKNPINLGFGDERDDFYSTIEDYNQNEYLRFMKSFSYSKNNNYKLLFDYIEESEFQVQILGHSCGLSDRTLLNAIFEHSNCKSIKVYFHEYNESKENGELDNYSEVVRNISRHFTQKTNMRDKIVNRTRCQSLPQRKD